MLGSVRAFLRLFIALLFIAVAVPTGIAISFWFDQGPVAAQASANDAVRQPLVNGRLSAAERTIAIDQFGPTWGMRAFPCRTGALIWTDITDPDQAILSTPVSQKLATALLSDRGNSVRTRLRRFVVACQLEQRFSDAQMLRAWLSTASFGQNLRGVENAAQTVFAKPASALNAEESAKLAALLRSPGLRAQPDQWTRRAQQIQAHVAAMR